MIGIVRHRLAGGFFPRNAAAPAAPTATRKGLAAIAPMTLGLAGGIAASHFAALAPRFGAAACEVSAAPAIGDIRDPKVSPPPEALRADVRFMLEAVRRDGSALQYASEDLRRDRSFVLEAVRRNGQALQFAAPELRRDRAIVLEAVRNSGLAVQFASDDLRADREVALEAIRESGWAMQFLPPELQQDRTLHEDGGMGWTTGGY